MRLSTESAYETHSEIINYDYAMQSSEFDFPRPPLPKIFKSRPKINLHCHKSWGTSRI